jgi:DNA-directed RNA polymerase subunit beta
VGRAKAFEAIVKGIDIPASNVPESFKVLVKELQALSLNIIPTGAVTVPPKPFDLEEVKNEAVIEKTVTELATEITSVAEEPKSEEATVVTE